jgi:hypothetical protein
MRDLTQTQALAVFAVTAAILITAFVAASPDGDAPLSRMAVAQANAQATGITAAADQVPRSLRMR